VPVSLAMGETVEARADIELGEAFRPAALAHAKIYRGEFGGTLIFGLIFAAGIVGGTTAGTVLGSWFPQLRDWATSILGLAGMVAGLFVGLRLYSRRHLAGFLDGLRKMGSPATFPTRFVFDDQGIRTENDRLSHHAAWPAVLLIIPSPDHWLVQVDTMTIAIPRRAFADAVAEQAFLALAKNCMSDEARARSVFAAH
jgi:hypothetical protein